MGPLKLFYPIKTLDGKLLLPAGSELSDESLKDLLASHHPVSLKTYPLMDHASVMKDLFDILNSVPYNIIFADSDCLSEIIDVMKSIRFGAPVLDVLDFFKHHDSSTYRHMLTIFALTILIARDLVPNYRKRVSEIAYGPTHDFGKICVPLDILKKEHPLTRDELNYLKHHAVAGYVLLSYYFRDRRSIAAKVARDHHERMNGQGYPRGINQQDLMIEIVAVCDVYDALISARPYRPVSYNNRTALDVLTSMAEKGEVGWRVVKSLIAHNRSSKPQPPDTVTSREKRGTPPPDNLYGKLSDTD
ncbi:MAG: HD domain-containing protein [Desulfobacteraceae bacterium]|nr:HD domain-containing protein [Desulfobacteraceae bacterium]MBC2756845.1 HD domain-containing protein [Desulfobacteraceae bacterium]